MSQRTAKTTTLAGCMSKTTAAESIMQFEFY